MCVPLSNEGNDMLIQLTNTHTHTLSIYRPGSHTPLELWFSCVHSPPLKLANCSSCKFDTTRLQSIRLWFRKNVHADLKGFFGKRAPRKRKEPPTPDTGGSKKSTCNEDEEKDAKAEASAVGDPLDAFANVEKM